MVLKPKLKNQFVGSAFHLIVVRTLVLCFLILSVFLPNVKITYYGERIYEDSWWYTSLGYESERSYAGLQYSTNWTVQWFAMPVFAFPFVLMYFGLKKRYTFDLGISVFALFFFWMILPPLTLPMSMGAGWVSIESEALIGSYIATIMLVVYSITRIFLRRATGGLEADRIPPPEDVEQSEALKRRFILVLALLSLVLPFAVEYKIYHYQTYNFPDYETAELTTVYNWFGKVTDFPLPFSPFFLPIVYLPLITMWLGMKRTGLFKNGVRLFTIYWVWHLLFFLQPFYIAEVGWKEHIIAPTVGLVFFPTILLLYVLSFLFKSPLINRLLLESGLKGAKATPKTFLKKCPKCGKEIPIASEECQYCKTKQP